MTDIAMWIDALATCAIENNEWAAETLGLLKSNPVEFYRRIAKLEQEQHAD